MVRMGQNRCGSERVARVGDRRISEDRTVHSPEVGDGSLGGEDANGRAAERFDDLGRRLDQLTTRVEAMAGLVENLADRSPRPQPASALTAQELADIAARMIRLIDVRLDSHTERLDDVIAALADERSRAMSHAFEADPDQPPIDHSIDENIALVGRAVLDVQRSIDEVRESLPDINELAIMAHVDRWFEETNARLAGDVDHIRREFHRLDQAVIEVLERVTHLPDRDSLSAAMASAPQTTSELAIDELRQLVADMPRHIALQDPVARLDASIIERLDQRMAQLSDELTRRIEEQLDARVQRFEALSQSMIALAGEPIDRITEKLSGLAAEREPAVAAARTIEELRDELAALRREGLEREALLRHMFDTERR
jgi:hypothetical protein